MSLPQRPRESVPLAAALMIIGSTFFVGLAALVKLASDEASPMQAVLYRSFFSMLPIYFTMRLQRIPVLSAGWRLLLLRGAVGFIALYCYLWAVAHIQLADVLALQQLNPILVAFLSVRFLGERPKPLHYLLALICSLGALLVIRPTRGIASLESAVALLSAIFSAGAYVLVRALTRSEPTPRIVFWFTSVAALLAAPFVIPGWRWLSWRANLLLITAGFAAAGAQVLMTAAYRRAPAHITSAFSYVTVPLAYLAGLLVWGERPDGLSDLGIALIGSAGVLIVISMPAGENKRT